MRYLPVIESFVLSGVASSEEVNNYAILLRKYKESVNSIMGEMSDSFEYAPVFVVAFWCKARHE